MGPPCAWCLRVATLSQILANLVRCNYAVQVIDENDDAAAVAFIFSVPASPRE